MLKVCLENNFNNKGALLVDEVKKGIAIYEIADVVVYNSSIEEVSKLVEEYKKKEDVLDRDITYFLDGENIECNCISDGYYSQEDFLAEYDGIIIDIYNEVVTTSKDYFDNWAELVYFHNYWDGHNWKTIELVNEGEKVELVKTIRYGNTYTIDAYYNHDENEIFLVLNSFYQGELQEEILPSEIAEHYSPLDDEELQEIEALKKEYIK